MAEPLPALRATHARKRRAPRSVEHPERVGVDTASKQAALRFLRGGLGVTPQVLVALHRIFVDPRVVARLVDAHRQGAPLARDVSPRLEDPRWLIEDPAFAWTPSKRDEDRALAHELSALVEQLVVGADAEREGHLHLRTLYYDCGYVAEVSQLAANAGEAANDAWHRLRGSRSASPFFDRRVQLPEVEMWQDVLEPLHIARWQLAEPQPELPLVRAALGAACAAFARCHRRLHEYRVRSEGGAQLAADTISIACTALACCLAAAPLAAEVFTARVALTLALRAATATAAVSLAARSGVVVAGLERFKVGALLLGTLEEAACNFVSTLLGGVLAEAFSRVICGFLLRELQPRALALLFRASHLGAEKEVATLVLKRGWQMTVTMLGSTAGALLAGAATIVVHDIRVLDRIPELDELMARLDAQLVHNGLATLLVEALGVAGPPVAAAR